MMSGVLLKEYPVVSTKLIQIRRRSPDQRRRHCRWWQLKHFLQVVVVARENPLSTDGCLRSFYGKAKSKLAAEVFDHPEAVLPRPVEAHLILRINGLRKYFLAICNSLSGFRRQRPLLTAGNDPATLKCCLSVKNPLAKYVAIALPVVGSYTGAEEISFPVSGQFGGADFAFRQAGQGGSDEP